MPSRPERQRGHAAVADPSAEIDLDTRILAAERAVIERDERVQRHAQQLIARGQHFAERLHENMGKAFGIGAAVVTGGLLLGRLLPALRGRGGALRAFAPAHGRRVGPAAAGAGRRHEVPWGRIVALAWPFMPLGLRARVSPGFAAFLMSLGLPLVAKALRPETDVQVAPDVDLRRYAGRWYEIGRTPLKSERRCAGNVSADYAPLDAATAEAEGGDLAVTNRCLEADGRVASVQGVARIVGGDSAKLQVSFAPPWLRWLPWAWADYWILDVDPHYRCALVGTPDRRHLWMLSRAPSLSSAGMQRLLEQAQAQGYDISRLQLTPQGLVPN